MPSLLATGLIVAGGALAPALLPAAASQVPSIRVERSEGNVTLRTPVGSFVTYNDDLPAALLGAATGGEGEGVHALDASVTLPSRDPG